MRKLTLSLAAFALVCSCFAPIRTAPPAGWKPPNEATPEEMKQSQGLQKTVGEVGSVPERTEEQVVQTSSSDPNARNVLARAGRMGEDQKKAEAQQVLLTAEHKLDEEKSAPFNMALIAVLVLGAGFGSVYGLKKWTEKAMPEPPKRQDVSW